MICRFLIPPDSRSGFPNHHGPCRYTRSLDRIGKVAVEIVLGVSTERFGHPSEIKKKWRYIFLGKKIQYRSVMTWDTEKSNIVSWLYSWEESEFKETTNGQFCAGNHWWPLVIPIELLQSPSPQSHVWGWRARIMAWRIWVRSKKVFSKLNDTKMPYYISRKKLLYHAYWFPSSSVRKWIPLTSGIHFMAPAPVWVQQSSLTDVRERLMALHWGPICTRNGCLTL